MSISALTRQSHTGQNFSEKIFCKGVLLYFEISFLSFIHKIFEQNFYLYITVYLVRIWTNKNADEKAHAFSRRSKNVKKRTKTYEKRILCKFTLIVFLQDTGTLLRPGTTDRKFETLKKKLHTDDECEFSSKVDRATAGETVDLGSVPGQIKSKTVEIGFHSFCGKCSVLKRNSVKSRSCVISKWQIN